MNYNHPAERHILRTIEESIENELSRIGLFQRIFGRVKSQNSIEKKLLQKKEIYVGEKRKMQDLFGLRVAVYFNDDIQIARKAVSMQYSELLKDSSIDKLAQDVFGPVRYNIIYTLPNLLRETSLLLKKAEFIDSTFEVQYRSVLSEGWHEVEHDLRYKCKTDWEGFSGYSRSLNGIYATLENCDISMIKIFTDLSYSYYLQKNWTGMIRNLFRLRFENGKISHDIEIFINAHPNFAKSLVSMDRTFFMERFLESQISIPLTYDNIVFLANRFTIKNKHLLELEPNILTEMCEQWVVE